MEELQLPDYAFFHLLLFLFQPPELLRPALFFCGESLPSFSLASAMAGCTANGKWDAPTVTNNDITKLKRVGYLSADIAHRAPKEGQVMPTPKPGDRVFFLPHFIRGWGFLCTPS